MRRRRALTTAAAEVAETMAGIRRDAPEPVKKCTATLPVLREPLAPAPNDFTVYTTELCCWSALPGHYAARSLRALISPTSPTQTAAAS